MKAPRVCAVLALFAVSYLLIYSDIQVHISLLRSKVRYLQYGGDDTDTFNWSFLFTDRTLSYNSRLISYVTRELNRNSKHPFSKLIRKSQDILSSVRQRCEEENLGTTWGFGMNPVPKPRMLIKRTQQKILFASNPKTGSTSFKRFLFYLDGDFQLKDGYHDKPRGHFEIVHSLKEDEANFRFSFGEFIKIGAIRNPLTRLLSAFRDKQLRKAELLKPGVNFTENTSDFEVFTKFIDTYLLTPSGALNPHFSSQWDQMEVCRWPYDLLIPYEDISGYLELFQDMTKTSSTPYPGSRENIGVDKHSSTYYSDIFYSQLDPRRMNAIYELYALDFKLLGYSRFSELDFPNLSNISRPFQPDV